MRKNIHIWLLSGLLAMSIFIGGCTSMQTAKVPETPKYPARPITMIVPFSAGSAMDITARMLEKDAVNKLGQPLVIVNKPGGTGTIGWNELVSSSADGYTVGMSGIDVILQPLYGATKYNYQTALEPVAQISPCPLVMVIKGDQPWENVAELIDYAKSHPKELKFGHWGTGSISHVVGQHFAQTTEISLEQVPFRGGAEAVTALLGGHVQIAFLSPLSVKEHMKSGTVKVLAVTTEQRLTDPIFAQVPTFKELGLDLVISDWFGVVAPKEMPVEIRNKLAKGFEAIITDPGFKKNMENAGLQVEYLNPQESGVKWLRDNKKLEQLVNETGILELIKAQKQ